MKSSPALTEARRKIIDLLKTRGPDQAENLAKELSLTGMAVRQHLYALQEKGFVDYVEEGGKRGRPAKIWQVTSKTDAIYPDRHNNLVVQMIQAATKAFGDDGFMKLLKSRTSQILSSYKQLIPQGDNTQKKVKALSKLRSDEGYMAEMKKIKEGHYQLIENHCPICVAAQSCQRLCDGELEVFQKVLGNQVKVERTEHLLDGSRRCVYDITES